MLGKTEKSVPTLWEEVAEKRFEIEEGLVFYHYVFLQTGTEELLKWNGVNLI